MIALEGFNDIKIKKLKKFIFQRKIHFYETKWSYADPSRPSLLGK